MFELLVRQGVVEAIQVKVGECGIGVGSRWGVWITVGAKLRRLAGEFAGIQTMEQIDAPLIAFKDYLKDIQRKKVKKGDKWKKGTEKAEKGDGSIFKINRPFTWI